jgi:S-DNA-T family DNA segregation ATPase FtsK/SpoIIIE
MTNEGAAEDRLVPLPRRTLGDDPESPTLAASPTAAVVDLLERTDHLLAQLEADIASLRRDQDKERQRIEREAEERQAAAEAAIARLQQLAIKARTIAEHKARTEVLDEALARKVPLDKSVSFDELVMKIEEEIRLAKGITGAIRLATIGDLLKQATLRVEHMTKQADRARQRFLKETEQELKSEGKEARASYEIGMSVVRRDLKALDLALPPSGLAWDDARWQHWPDWDPLSGVSHWVRLGTYYRPQLERFRFPALLELPGGPGVAIDVATADRDRAIAAARSVLLRILASIQPGDVRFTFVDPAGLGDSVAPFLPLGEYRSDLIDEGVCTREDQIEEKFGEIARHIERVIQDHLRGDFDTIDECNRSAGEVVEPYRVVTVFDFPNQLSDAAKKLLLNIIANGPRCGVYTILVTAPGAARAHGARWKAMLGGLQVITGTPDGFVVDHGGMAGVWNLDFDEPPELTIEGDEELTLFGRILTTVGEEAKVGRAQTVNQTRVFELLSEATKLRARDDLPVLASTAAISADDPSTWWTANSTELLSAPIGRSGPRDVTCLALDSSSRAGALVGGEPGSGRSMVLHDLILSLSMLYPPDELALYLVDFAGRSSAPFEAYATEGLPHARVVAIESEREFGVSVLDGLVREMTRRSMLLAPHGGERAGIEGYRQTTGDTLARIVLVVDGTERLFALDDRVSDRAAQLLDTLARQGAAHGIHLVLATNAMRSLERLGRHTSAQLRVRVALACSEDESKRILEDTAASASRFEHAGQGALAVIGSGGGEAQDFQATFVDAHERGLTLRDLRRLADERGITRRPQVFEGNAPARLEDSAILGLARNAEKQGVRLQPRLWLGEPVVLGGPVEATLHRDAGSNLLVVGRDQRLGQGLVMAALASAALGHGRELDVRVLDFMPLESGFAEMLSGLGQHVPVTVHRRRQFAEVIGGVQDEIARRTAAQDFRARPLLFVIDGLGAARELDVQDPASAPLVDGLETIVRDGPEVGVHTIMWADSPITLTRRVTSATLQAFSTRVVLQLPADDSALLIDSGSAATLKENQALLYDEHASRLTKLRPYQLPSEAFVGRLLHAATRRATVSPPGVADPAPRSGRTADAAAAGGAKPLTLAPEPTTTRVPTTLGDPRARSGRSAPRDVLPPERADTAPSASTTPASRDAGDAAQSAAAARATEHPDGAPTAAPTSSETSPEMPRASAGTGEARTTVSA